MSDFKLPTLPMTELSKAEDIGRIAYRRGLGLSQNPFLRTDYIEASAAWNRGYVNAEIQDLKIIRKPGRNVYVLK